MASHQATTDVDPDILGGAVMSVSNPVDLVVLRNSELAGV
jgi:hypothetical protein